MSIVNFKVKTSKINDLKSICFQIQYPCPTVYTTLPDTTLSGDSNVIHIIQYGASNNNFAAIYSVCGY